MLLLGSCFLLTSICTFLVPLTSTITWLLVITFINHFADGSFVTGTTTYLYSLWGKGTPPFLLANQLVYGFGSLVSPLIAAHFLSQRDGDASESEGRRSSSAFWPFAILSVYQLACALFAFVTYCASSNEAKAYNDREPEGSVESPDTTQEKDENPAHVESELRGEGLQLLSPDKDNSWKRWRLLVLMFMILFIHVYVGVGASFGNFLTTFTVNSNLKLSESQGAQITAAYWTCYTVVGLCSIFYIKKVGSERNLFCSIFAILISNILLLPFGDSDVNILIIGVCVAGMGESTIWGSLYGFLEEYMPITPHISACINVSGYLALSTFPYLFYRSIEHDPRILLYVVLWCSVALCVTMSFMSLTCRLKLKK